MSTATTFRSWWHRRAERRACARGDHLWVGGSSISNGMYTGNFWCMTCKVKRGDPPYDGGTYNKWERQ